MHIDVWMRISQLSCLSLVDFGTDGAYAGGDDTAHVNTLNIANSAVWNSTCHSNELND